VSRALLALALAACSGEPDAPPPVEQLDAPEAEAQAEAVAALDSQPKQAPEPVAGAEPVEIVLVWQGIGNLHRSFFSNAEAVSLLSTGLAGRVEGPANIYVRHDGVEYVGSIRLQLRPDTLQIEVGTEGDVIALQDLTPLTAALAGFRSYVAGHFDFRVESFSVGLESFRGPHSCIFGVAGEHPPDGLLVSPCVVVDGKERCGEATPVGVRFDPGVAKIVRSCLDR